MKFSLKILESNDYIEGQILKALIDDCRDYMDKAIQTIKNELPQILYFSIVNRAEYSSLVSGKLRLEFGVPDAGPKIASIIHIWISNIFYSYKSPAVVGRKIKGSFSAELIRSDFSDVLGMSEARVIDLAGGYELPWLQWLLTAGSNTIIPAYNVVLGPNPRSRTGGAVMRVSSQGWRVPSEHAGTINDNWITRAIEEASQPIEQLLQRAFNT